MKGRSRGDQGEIKGGEVEVTGRKRGDEGEMKGRTSARGCTRIQISTGSSTSSAALKRFASRSMYVRAQRGSARASSAAAAPRIRLYPSSSRRSSGGGVGMPSTAGAKSAAASAAPPASPMRLALSRSPRSAQRGSAAASAVAPASPMALPARRNSTSHGHAARLCAMPAWVRVGDFACLGGALERT